MSKEKSAFEKIRSASEARIILGKLVEEGNEFYCKGDSGPLFGFKPVHFDASQSIQGILALFDDQNLTAESVVINFSVGSDRYYTVAVFAPAENGRGVLKLSEPIYRLERRAHLRVAFPEKISRSANVIAHNGKSCFVPAELVDISVGGARLKLEKSKFASVSLSSEVRCVYHVKNKWTLELPAIVRYVGDNHDGFLFLGLQFTEKDEVVKRRLLSLMLELQREVLREAGRY